MIELPQRTRCIRASHLHELLEGCDARSVVDPFMGLPTHLNYLKRHDLAVHGGDLLEWFVRVGEGIVINDSTILRDHEVAEIVEMLPGRVYPLDAFKAWEGAFFSEEQCVYLSIWRENVRNLRSDGQIGLATLGLWRVFCYWIHKAQAPDEMEDIAPSELAWSYIRQTQEWVGANARHHTMRRADALVTIEECRADALFLALPSRNAYLNADPRVWMWEAWWQGNPYFTIENVYRDTLFGAGASEPPAYARAAATLIARAAAYPSIIVQIDERGVSEMESLLHAARPSVEIVTPSSGEIYLIAKK